MKVEAIAPGENPLNKQRQAGEVFIWAWPGETPASAANLPLWVKPVTSRARTRAPQGRKRPGRKARS